MCKLYLNMQVYVLYNFVLNTNFVTLNYFCSMKRNEYFIIYIISKFKKFYTLFFFFIKSTRQTQLFTKGRVFWKLIFQTFVLKRGWECINTRNENDLFYVTNANF